MPASRAAFSQYVHHAKDSGDRHRNWDLAEHHEILLWLEESRQERLQEREVKSNVSSGWTSLEEYARLGVTFSNGKRVGLVHGGGE